MSRPVGTVPVFGFGLVFAATASFAACGGGSGDVTGPPGGAGSVDSLVLNLDSADVIVGDTVRLTAEARDAAGKVVPGIRLTYSSSDPAVATVTDDGLVTAVALGDADIEVAIAGDAGAGASSVAAPSAAAIRAPRRHIRFNSVPHIVLLPGEQLLDTEVTSQYFAVLTNIRGEQLPTTGTPTWSSSEPSVATVDNTGLVTTVKEGRTRIGVTFTMPGRGRRVTEDVLLHVAVCSGIFLVPRWQAEISVVYEEGGFAAGAQATYSVNQGSNSSTVLEVVPGQSGADSLTWEGKTSGDASVTNVRLDNLLTFPVPPPVNTGRTTETRSGPIQDGSTAVARLVVKRPSAGGGTCTYNFQYGDYFTWTVNNNQGAPPLPKAGPTGTALLVGREVGLPTTEGHWVLGDLTTAELLPARAFADPSTSHYVPGSTIAVSMIIALGGAGATRGNGEFVHYLTGDVPF